MPTDREILQIVQRMARAIDADQSMAALQRRAGWSAAHLHRDFRRVVGETPKQYALRLRLTRAAAALGVQTSTIGDVAAQSGFASHEVFSRAFRRHFGRTPRELRARAMTGDASHDTAIVLSVAPCLTLFRFSSHTPRRGKEITMTHEAIERRELPAQPVLFIRRRTSRDEIAATLSQCLPAVFLRCQTHGLAMAGPPFTRYVEAGMGLLTIEGGLPLCEPAEGEGEIEAGELPGGPVACTVHVGPYDTLHETYVAMERWLEKEGLSHGGAPWESYLTDPGEEPDPAKWRTLVVFPLGTG